jgi:ApaG protein
MFTHTSQNFQIDVKTGFDFQNSNPMRFHYLFKYNITITNKGLEQAQLISRKWFIKDGKGELRTVEGPGVIGHTPKFQAGESFNYSSFCPLPTLTGEMWGHFNMIDGDNNRFKIETPHFFFSVPEDFIDRY